VRFNETTEREKGTYSMTNLLTSGVLIEGLQVQKDFHITKKREVTCNSVS